MTEHLTEHQATPCGRCRHRRLEHAATGSYRPCAKWGCYCSRWLEPQAAAAQPAKCTTKGCAVRWPSGPDRPCEGHLVDGKPLPQLPASARPPRRAPALFRLLDELDALERTP